MDVMYHLSPKTAEEEEEMLAAALGEEELLAAASEAASLLAEPKPAVPLKEAIPTCSADFHTGSTSCAAVGGGGGLFSVRTNARAATSATWACSLSRMWAAAAATRASTRATAAWGRFRNTPSTTTQ